jgi:hypothetical protein
MSFKALKLDHKSRHFRSRILILHISDSFESRVTFLLTVASYCVAREVQLTAVRRKVLLLMY